MLFKQQFSDPQFYQGCDLVFSPVRPRTCHTSVTQNPYSKSRDTVNATWGTALTSWRRGL